VEALAGLLKARDAGLVSRDCAADVERLFGVYYSTEIERAVLKAALTGMPLPRFEPPAAGNDVELF